MSLARIVTLGVLVAWALVGLAFVADRLLVRLECPCRHARPADDLRPMLPVPNRPQGRPLDTGRLTPA